MRLFRSLTHTKLLQTFVCVCCIFFLATPLFVFAGNPFDAVGEFLKGLVFGFFTGLGMLFAGLGGMLLDISIKMLVLDMGKFLTGPFGASVQNLWLVIRDIFNLFFIFSLVYVGIKTILFSEDTGTRRLLGNLILAAVFINFSLYITQVLVDFSNILSLQIYQQISVKVNIATNQFTLSGISGAFIDASGLLSIMGDESILKNINDPVTTMVFSILMFIFLFIAGMVFMWGAFLLVTRFVTLILYMIFSPVMFLGWILPFFAERSRKWWEGFLKQAFFAPAFLFMILLSLVVLRTLRQDVIGNSSFGSIFEGGSITDSSFGIVLFFTLMIGFLYASIQVAQQMGAIGAGAAMNSLNAVKKSVTGGVSGFAYRNTAGRGLRGVAGLYDRMDQASTDKKRGLVTKSFATVGKSVLGGESGRRAIMSASNAGVGGGQGLEDAEKMNKERDKRVGQAANIRGIIKNTNASEQARAISKASAADLGELAGSKEGQAVILQHIANIQPDKIKALKEHENMTDDFGEALDKNRKDSIERRLIGGAAGVTLNQVIGKATKNDLAAIGPDKLAEPEFAVRLSESQIKDLDFADVDVQKIKANRKAALIQVANGTAVGGLTHNDLLKANSDEIASLPDEVFVNNDFTKGLTASALQAIGRPGKKGTAVQANIRAILEPLAAPAYAGPRTPADAQRFATINDWLNINPNGMLFGK